jgi:uncharacterized lipoprotein
LNLLFKGVLIGALLVSSGCSSLPGQSGPDSDYKNAEQGRSLELPPRLGGGEKRPQVVIPRGQGCAPCAEVAAAQPAAEVVLPRLSDARMVRDGAVNWLEVSAPVESVWAGLGEFTDAQGFGVARQSARDGVLETDWIDNTRALASPALDALLRQNIPAESLGLHRFSFRLERAGQSASRVFVRHEGLINADDNPSLTIDDPEMASRLMVDLLAFFGVDGRRASQVVTGS